MIQTSSSDSLKTMFETFSKGNSIFLPSKFWQNYNEVNSQQISKEGLENIKQTVAMNYFTWKVGLKDRQLLNLIKKTHLKDWPSILIKLFSLPPSSHLTKKDLLLLNFFTRMLWKYTQRKDIEKRLKEIKEPEEGNPFKFYIGKQLISQDLSNSLLEYYSIRECIPNTPSDSFTICELGAGYGRTAYVMLNVFPKAKYIVVDIPPALYVSQHYLTQVFPNKKIFQFRPFENFKEVADEFNSADIAFLLPHQAETLPEKSVNLFVNISSLHEMLPSQISAYFSLIDKVTKGHFYSKQWYKSINPFDKIQVKREDYPIPGSWETLFDRQTEIQPAFFEAMYQIPG